MLALLGVTRWSTAGADPVTEEARTAYKPPSILATFAALGGLTVFHNLLLLSLPLYTIFVGIRVIPTGDVMTSVALFVMIVVAVTTDFAIDTSRLMLLNRLACRASLGAHGVLGSVGASDGVLRQLLSLRAFMAGPMALALLDLPCSFLFVGSLFLLHTTLGLVTIVVIVSNATVGVFASRSNAVERRRRIQLEGRLLRFSSSLPFPAFGCGRPSRHLGELAADLITGNGLSSERQGRSYALLQSTRLLGQAVIIGLSGLLVARKEIPPGSLLGAVILFGRAILPFERCSDIVPIQETFTTALAVIRALRVAASAPPKISRLPERCAGVIALVDVALRDADEAGRAVNTFSTEVRPGEITVVVGPAGSGKSKMLRLLGGLIEPRRGRATLDDVPMNEIERGYLEAAVGYLSDNTVLGNCSVAENIVGPMDADDAAMVEAADLAGVHDVIMALRDGYSTPAHGPHSGLSRSAEQGIALAKAFYGRPRIILLDEPTCHLDETAEMRLASILAMLRGDGSNIVVVSKSERIHALADQFIYVEREGRVVRTHMRVAARILPKTRDPQSA